jgi:SAM-dependent methyltransferase
MTTMAPSEAPAALDPEAEFQRRRREHWDARSTADPGGWWLGGGYHRRLREIHRHVIPAGSSVLELGCGRGDLLAAVEPSRGVGVDFSARQIEAARQRHPGLTFIAAEADAAIAELEGAFDYIIVSDLLNDLWDVERTLRALHRLTHPGTRLVITSHSRLWQLPLGAARRLGLARPLLPQNWLAPEDVRNLLHLAGFETLRAWGDCLLPLRIPLLWGLANRWLAKVAPFRWFDLTTVTVARPAGPGPWKEPPLVSVVVPARNEAGNIAEILRTVPEMGAGTELIFVEGNSSDDTYAVIERELAKQPGRRARLLKQPGRGKGDAVRHGWEHASGEILMILDADLTVPAAALPRFYQALLENRGEMINGVRLVYPMADRAMRFANLIANRGFSLAFSWLLGQPIKDTLCGTKALSRANWRRIVANRAHFGDFDPFGDFDLIFGAAKLDLRLVDLPVRYRERIYGETNIQRWRHGVILLRMLVFAARRLKFR